LLLGCGASVVLFMSWYLEPTRSLWLTIDDRVFWALNGSLAGVRSWQIFWAAANERAADIVVALCILGLFARFLLGEGRNRKDAVAAIFLMLTGLVIAGVEIGKALPISRLSPTLVHPDALRLSELVFWMPTKDASGDCFPGDHATALLIFAGVVTFYLPRTYAAAAWVIAIVFMIPRAVDGAHWLTDDLVGSVAVAGVVLSCVFATPLHNIMTNGLGLLIDRLRSYELNLFSRHRFGPGRTGGRLG
jgi:membrane-associated phospholipid phosphatase